LFSRRATNFAAACAVSIGLLVICWMTLPQYLPEQFRAPFHANLTMVVGTLTIFLVGLAISSVFGRPASSQNVT
jgi:SSS family solute:Na+ symporter